MDAILEDVALSAKFDGSDYDRELLLELFARLDKEAISLTLLNLKKDADNKCFNRVFGLKEVLYYLKLTLKDLSLSRARSAKIKGFKGSKLAERELLEKFIYKELLNKLPKWAL